MKLLEHCNGFTISARNPVHFSDNVHREQSKRGKIDFFSSKSAARLRELLLKLECPEDKYTCAITLTIPCKIDASEWRNLLERFRTKLLRCKIGMIWRVELQKRKVPHLHCVAICGKMEDIGEIWYAWVASADSVCEGILPCDEGFIAVPVSCHSGFLCYGFSCRVLRGQGWFRYVASHSAKHKQSQLGWQGRQWGIFNKQFLSFKSCSEITVDDGFLVFLGRCCRRRFRCRLDLMRPTVRYDFFVSPFFLEKAKSWYYRDLPF